MIQALKWAIRRLSCGVRGHRMVSDRIFYAPAKSIISGYRCERCGKTQSVLYRWQSLYNDRKEDTDINQNGDSE